MTLTTHHRRSIRLKDYDYSLSGAYFVTICAFNREHLFGGISNGEMKLSEVGQIVAKWWLELNHKFPSIETDAYVIMPNHFHGIVAIVGADLRVCPEAVHITREGATDHATGRCDNANASIPRIVQWFKTMTTNEYFQTAKQRAAAQVRRKLWQRNYYEHVIRDDAWLHRIREYILTNPLRWALDHENPDRKGDDEFDLWLSSFRKRPIRRKSGMERIPEST